jgi:hypothetical protein
MIKIWKSQKDNYCPEYCTVFDTNSCYNMAIFTDCKFIVYYPGCGNRTQ